MSLYTLLNNATAVTGATPPIPIQATNLDLAKPNAVLQAILTGTGSVTATVNLVGSNDGLNWSNTGVITLTGTTKAIGFVAQQNPWAYYGATLTALTGTGASVTATLNA